jgi:hypothetical protein
MKTIKFLLSPFTSYIFYAAIIGGLILMTVLPIDSYLIHHDRWWFIGFFSLGAYLAQLIKQGYRIIIDDTGTE